MAYLLRETSAVATSARVDFANPIALAGSTSFELRIDIEVFGAQWVFAGETAITSANIIFLNNNTTFELRRTAGGNVSWTLPNAYNSGRYTYVLRTTGAGLELTQDGVICTRSANTNEAMWDIRSLFTLGNASRHGDLYGFEVDINGSPAHNYDPSASNGTGSTLIDTAGANDGTLVNFPTDNSQWVFYSAGGVTANTAITIPAPLFASTASATQPQPSADATITIPAPTFSATGTATLPQPVADIAYTISAPVFSATAAATLPQPVSDVAITINAPTFAATASATIPGFTSTVAITIPEPQFSSTASVTLPQPSADIGITISEPVFSASATASLPQPVSDVAFTVSAPLFSATATATLPGYTATVNVTIPEPLFSASGSVTLPQPDAAVSLEIPAPIFSVVAIVGGIAIIVDNETNINAPALSNNIDVQALSNNINA